MPEPPADNSARLALDLLVWRYQNAHGLYRKRSDELRLWRGGALVTLAASPIIFGARYFLGSEVPLDEAVFTTTGLCAIAAGRMTWLLWAKRRLRKEMQRLKRDLNHVGFHLACDRERWFEPKLLLQSQKPTGDKIVNFDAAEIDFKLYDRDFRM